MVDEAKKNGLELLGPGSKNNRRTYKWIDCGHVFEYGTGSVRWNNIVCRDCEQTAFTLPSNVYLFLIKASDGLSWVKLGVSRNLDTRHKRYGLPDNTTVQLVDFRPVQTGIEAISIEKSLHIKYKKQKLNSKIMLDYHTKSGATECYPLHLLHDLHQELRKI